MTTALSLMNHGHRVLVLTAVTHGCFTSENQAPTWAVARPDAAFVLA